MRRTLTIWALFLIGWLVVMTLAVRTINDKVRSASAHVYAMKLTATRRFYRHLDFEVASFRDMHSRGPKDWSEFRTFLRSSGSGAFDFETFLNGKDAWERDWKLVQLPENPAGFEIHSPGRNGDFGDADDLVWSSKSDPFSQDSTDKTNDAEAP